MLSYLKKITSVRFPTFFSKMNFSSDLPKWDHAGKSQILPKDFTEAYDEVTNPDESPFVVVDVREDGEISFADLPFKNKHGVRVPKLDILMNALFKDPDVLEDIPKDKHLVVMCHHGVRSHHSAEFLKTKGFTAMNLAGGIDKISDIWPKIPKY